MAGAPEPPPEQPEHPPGPCATRLIQRGAGCRALKRLSNLGFQGCWLRELGAPCHAVPHDKQTFDSKKKKLFRVRTRVWPSCILTLVVFFASGRCSRVFGEGRASHHEAVSPGSYVDLAAAGTWTQCVSSRLGRPCGWTWISRYPPTSSAYQGLPACLAAFVESAAHDEWCQQP